MEDTNMAFGISQNASIKQEVEDQDEIDNKVFIKTEFVDCQSQSETMLPVHFDRIKMEQVKLENEDITDLHDDTKCYIKTEGQFKIEKAEPKIERRQDNEDCESDATTDSDVVLERLLSEHIKMDNQSEHDMTMKINETVKTEYDDEEVKVKTEPADMEMDVSSGVEDTGVQQLTEEFEVKNEGYASSDEAPDTASKKNAPEEGCSSSTVCFNPDARKLNRRKVANGKTTKSPLNPLNSESCADSEYTSLGGMEIGDEIKDECFDDEYNPEMRLENKNIGGRGSSASSACSQCHVKCKSRIFLYEHILKNHPDLVAFIDEDIYDCPNCTFKTVFSARLTTHLMENCLVCGHCSETFKRKRTLNNHIIKMHPDSVSSVSNTIYECTNCTYKNSIKRLFDDHLLTQHPDRTADVTSVIHECSKCSYKTSIKSKLAKHMLKHTQTTSTPNLIKCKHCSSTFQTKVSLDNHILKNHPDFVSSVSNKIRECPHCPFKTTIKSNFDRHMLKHPEASYSYNLSKCLHCSASFQNKSILDDHILKKHPDFLASVSSKIHECTKCAFKTTIKSYFNKHMQTHPEISGYKPNVCTHCDLTFKSKITLDDHIIRMHPDCISSVSSKLHECTFCIYKTTRKNNLNRHTLLKHPENLSDEKFSTCVHCHAVFPNDQKRNEHILKNHPDCIESIPSDIHECVNCSYKTTIKNSLTKHIKQYHETVPDSKLITCTHCSATFQRKGNLDNHILRNHPDFVSSVSDKILECTVCTYKTTLRSRLTKHIQSHPESSSYKPKVCIYCNASFKGKPALDDHIIKKHPDFLTSVSSKIHHCKNCTYKTTNLGNLNKHMLKHPGGISSYNFISCIHCDAVFRTNKVLGDHILRNHPSFSASVTSKIHECNSCSYKTTIKTRLEHHILKDHPDSTASASFTFYECTICAYKTIFKNSFAVHMLKHPETASTYEFFQCMHCDKTFRYNDVRNEHILRKHPDRIESITYKIHECKICTYKTTNKRRFDHHLLRKHSEIVATTSSKTYECTFCTYKTTMRGGFYEHMLRNHPNSNACITSKIHECPNCAYKTIMKKSLDEHMLKTHPKSAESISSEIYNCSNCSYKSCIKRRFDNHILMKHLDLIAAVSSSIYECKNCTYKTTIKNCLVKHSRKHRGSYKCIHCGVTLQTEETLDNHILREHPDFIASVSRTVYECSNCTYKTINKMWLDNHIVRQHPDSIENISSIIYKCANCSYKTTIKKSLVRHMQRYSKSVSSHKLIKCIHCSGTFQSKRILDDHILRSHPDFASSISSKIHECTICTYKTTHKGNIVKHMRRHSKASQV